MTARARAAFLDRDGTLIDELEFLRQPADLRLLPGAAEGVRVLCEGGYKTVVVTNQSGIARGLLDEVTLAEIHGRLRHELERAGARLDAILYCPHHPDYGPAAYRRTCECRKPAPGLVLRAARELELDLPRSWMIGDSLRDLECARAAGLAGSVLVLTGKWRAELLDAPPGERLRTAPDLLAAANWLVQGK